MVSPRPSNTRSKPRFIQLQVTWRRGILLLLGVVLFILCVFVFQPSVIDEETLLLRQEYLDAEVSTLRKEGCAILFWGLPRAFASLVLPSLVENVLLPNAKYNCDFFVHYYNLTEEGAGRSSNGGHVNASEIVLLEDAVRKLQPPRTGQGQVEAAPVVRFQVDQEEDFWKQYGDLIHKIRYTKDANGNYLYFPWKAISYVHPVTTDNIVKMWHTIQSAWNLMEDYVQQERRGIQYSRVAMLRSDVVYVTPIDIYHSHEPNTNRGKDENDNDDARETMTAVIPGFGRYPVSDRIIYGPHDAVQVWATQRFARLEAHVQLMYQTDPGMGMHSESFVKYQILPTIGKLGFTVQEHPTMCFFRARADESVWISDCDLKSLESVTRRIGHEPNQQPEAAVAATTALVEQVLGRKCGKISIRPQQKAYSLDCSRGREGAANHA